MTTRERLYALALEKGLRQSTLYSYERLLGRLGVLDMEDVSQEFVLDRLYSIDNANTRRAAVIACRSVFGWKIKIPKGVPRRYVLPDEDTLRLALMTSPHEARGLLMMYAGLRIGEACAVTSKDLDGDRLTVSKQVVLLHKTGHPTTIRLGPVKASEASVIIPWHLAPIINSLPSEGFVRPDGVRESLRRAGMKVGIKLSPHMLRKWYCTHLISNGIPLALVQQQMRHSDISVTLAHYQQYSDSDIHNLFDRDI